MFERWYKCRWCGSMFSVSAFVSGIDVDSQSELERSVSSDNGRLLIAYHHCRPNRTAIGDLVGVQQGPDEIENG